ncbi:MAG: hypothetical protein WCW14_02455 [Candidatus Paceibacterota bacterium]|jgi:hypothetical protein
MHIIKRLVGFIKKVTNVVKDYRVNKDAIEIYQWMESWRSAWEWQRQQDLLEQEYLKQCKEEDKRIAEQEKVLLAQILEEKRTEENLNEELRIRWEEKLTRNALENKRADDLYYQEMLDALADEDQCHGCGYPSRECTCYLDEEEDGLEVPQMGLPGGDDEEDISLLLEQVNERCPNCGLLPDLCQCQYEDEK